MSTWNDQEDGVGWEGLVPSRAEREAERAEQHQAAIVRSLVSALNAMLTYFGMEEDEWSRPTFDQARKAIAEAAAR